MLAYIPYICIFNEKVDFGEFGWHTDGQWQSTGRKGHKKAVNSTISGNSYYPFDILFDEQKEKFEGLLESKLHGWRCGVSRNDIEWEEDARKYKVLSQDDKE